MKLNLTPRVVAQHPVAVTALGLGVIVAGCFSGAEYGSTGGAGGQGGTTAGAAGTTTIAGGATGVGVGGAAAGAAGGNTAGMGGAVAAGGTGAMAGASGAGTGAMGGSSGAGTGGAAGGAGGAMGGAAGAGGTGPTYDCSGVDDEGVPWTTACTGGKADGKDCSGINQLATMDADDFPGGDGNDIWGWTDPDTDKEYALMGLNGGTAFVDISDPCRPVHLGNLRTETQNALWRDIKVYKNYAYIVAESAGHGLQVFDLTQLRNVASPPAVFEATNVVSTFGSSHNLALNPETGYAYVLAMDNCADGRSFNLADPANPVDEGCWGSGSRTHDAFCTVYQGPDAAYQGKELCFTGSERRGLWVYDMTDKGDVAVVAQQVQYPDIDYAHQVWLTEDHSTLFMCDESDEINNGINMTINIFSLANVASPTHIGAYVSPMGNADHNIFVRGNYAFLAAYSGGLRVLDVSNAASGTITEVGYFDTYTQNNDANFDGQWGVYPYFKSGVIITNGIINGMHILEPNPAWMQASRWMGW